MSLLRRLLVPAVLSTPLVLLLVRLRPSWGSSTDDLSAADWLWAFLLTLIGLILIGLPAASMLRRLRAKTALKIALLLIVGAAGGGAVAVLYVLFLGIAGDGFDVGVNVALIAVFGVLPGFATAIVWTFLNVAGLQNFSKARDA